MKSVKVYCFWILELKSKRNNPWTLKCINYFLSQESKARFVLIFAWHIYVWDIQSLKKIIMNIIIYVIYRNGFLNFHIIFFFNWRNKIFFVYGFAKYKAFIKILPVRRSKVKNINYVLLNSSFELTKFVIWWFRKRNIDNDKRVDSFYYYFFFFLIVTEILFLQKISF